MVRQPRKPRDRSREHLAERTATKVVALARWVHKVCDEPADTGELPETEIRVLTDLVLASLWEMGRRFNERHGE